MALVKRGPQSPHGGAEPRRGAPDSDHPNDSLMNETELQALCAALGLPSTSDAARHHPRRPPRRASKRPHAQASQNAAQVPDLAKFVPRADYDALQEPRGARRRTAVAHRAMAAVPGAGDHASGEIDGRAVKGGQDHPGDEGFFMPRCAAQGPMGWPAFSATL